jgi:hypothetical protein
MVACTSALDGNNSYLVAIGSLDENFMFEKEYKIFGDPLEQRVHAVVGYSVELVCCVAML